MRTYERSDQALSNSLSILLYFSQVKILYWAILLIYMTHFKLFSLCLSLNMIY